MTQISIPVLEPGTLKHFEEIKKKWETRLDEKKQSLEVSKIQLKEIIKSQTEKEVTFSESLKQFAANRGATLLFIVIAVVVVCLFFYLFWRLIVHFSSYNQKASKPFLTWLSTQRPSYFPSLPFSCFKCEK